jgi:hypothetical protein
MFTFSLSWKQTVFKNQTVKAASHQPKGEGNLATSCLALVKSVWSGQQGAWLLSQYAFYVWGHRRSEYWEPRSELAYNYLNRE